MDRLRDQYDDVEPDELKALQGEVRGLNRVRNLPKGVRSDAFVRKLDEKEE